MCYLMLITKVLTHGAVSSLVTAKEILRGIIQEILFKLMRVHLGPLCKYMSVVLFRWFLGSHAKMVVLPGT
jgi:hypothetical protein